MSSSGPLCTQSSLLNSFSQRNGVSLLASASLKSSYVLSNYFTMTEKSHFFFSIILGRKPRHQRPESPTPDITVKKDKYNKGNVIL